jgi:hypothetical protein
MGLAQQPNFLFLLFSIRDFGNFQANVFKTPFLNKILGFLRIFDWFPTHLTWI